ncbi:MarR family winged helix-turn-helix transcriptional regulator [Methylobacterium aquaticum]|uniref:MarR family winged helix-turn-helix transcriptional regulator n=1 Tax=Methylobacterium aquaticum TaxID=270351 RepID=UPI001FED948F|nr:helix-turn-helix domain-containing protein [Methylobacterium aquaticum]
MPYRMTPDTAAAIERACICVAVQRAARVIGREFDAVFRSVGLSNWQFTLLTVLALGDPPTMRELAEELALDKSTLTANVKLLEKRGLIATESDTHDPTCSARASDGVGPRSPRCDHSAVGESAGQLCGSRGHCAGWLAAADTCDAVEPWS